MHPVIGRICRAMSLKSLGVLKLLLVYMHARMMQNVIHFDKNLITMSFWWK